MILSGKQLSDNIKAQLKEQVATFPSIYGRVPHLAVILVGDDPASATYVRSKGKACELLGMKNTTIKLPAETTEAEVLEQIKALNEDDGVDGILVQLPLPRHIDEKKVLYAIKREKDVDGFHPDNVAALWLTSKTGEHPAFSVACTPRGIMRLLKAADVKVEGKRAVVIGRSSIVGLPVAKLLLNENATVTICHSRTADLPSVTREADIIVVAIGRPKFLTADMVKPGAVIIDVGINRGEDGKLYGDVDFENVEPLASVITPVPGGVGPMTICSLMENTIDCFLNRL